MKRSLIASSIAASFVAACGGGEGGSAELQASAGLEQKRVEDKTISGKGHGQHKDKDKENNGNAFGRDMGSKPPTDDGSPPPGGEIVFGDEPRFDAETGVLYGSRGNDFLSSDPGIRLMMGGPGNDTYRVLRSTDQIIEREGDGTDTVIAAVDYTLPEHVENLQPDPAAGVSHLTLRGNSLNNIIVNPEYRVQVSLFGGAGDDVLEVGTRAGGYVDGGEGNDTLVVSVGGATGGPGADLFIAKGHGAHTSPDIPISITDFNGDEGDRIHIRHIQDINLTGPELFDQNWMTFDSETGNLIFWQVQDIRSPGAVRQVIRLQGVTRFNPSWVKVGSS